jgi:hypothetical protein
MTIFGMQGAGIKRFSYVFFKMMSIVSRTGTFVKRDSTSSEAIHLALPVDLHSSMNSYVEPITCSLGIYFEIMLLMARVMWYTGVPICEIIGRSGGSDRLLWILGFP